MSEIRNNIDIYYDILLSIQNLSTYGIVKLSLIHPIVAVSQDCLEKCMDDLIEKGLIVKDTLRITKNGEAFLNDIPKIIKFLKKMGINDEV